MKLKLVKKVFFLLIISTILSINVVDAASCEALLTAEAAKFISEIMTIITIAIPILLIVLCSADLVSIVTSQDDGAVKKATSRIVKRFIAAAAFFFVPLLINLVLGIYAVKDSINLVDDPTCGIISE